MSDSDEIVYPLGKDMEYLKNKNYNMSALSIANMTGWIDTKNKHRIVNRKEFEKQLKQELHLTKYKCSVIIDAFIAADVIEEHGKDLWLQETKSNFLKLFVPTVKYCLNHLGDMEFKVYCILLNKYTLNQYYHMNENYFFSSKELLEMIGYNGTDGTNVRQMGETLTTLKILGLIDYSEDFVGRSGKHGLYRELYWAAQRSSTDVEASGLKDVKQQNILMSAEDAHDAKLLTCTSGEIWELN